MIAYTYAQNDIPHVMGNAVRHNILEFAWLMPLLLVAMTYINAMEERLVFESLRSWLTRRGFSYRQLFWLTGISAVAHCGQSHDSPAHGCRGHGGRRRKSAVRRDRPHQYRGCGQRGAPSVRSAT